MGGPDATRPEIGLGDAMRVWAALDLDLTATLRVLGLLAPAPEQSRPVPAPERIEAPDPAPEQSRPVPVPEGIEAPDRAVTGDGDRAAPRQSGEQPGPVSPFPSIEMPPQQRPHPPLIQAHPPGGPLVSGAPVRLPSVDEVLTTPTVSSTLADPSLLPPSRHRAILAALCRTTGPGEIDVPEVVQWLARAEPVDRLPTTLAPTMRRGVQVLVDLGPGMQPFLGDQRAVVQALRRLTGREGLEVLRFAGTPLDVPGAGPGPVWTWRRYRPPIDDRRVLVLSDLGGGPGHHDRAAVWARWLSFAAMFRHLRRPMVALVPVPAERLPPALRDRLPMVTWDRSTRVADAARAAGTMYRRRRRAA